MKPVIDRVGYILISLAVIFYVIIPLPYYVYIIAYNVVFPPEYRFAVWISQGLGILVTFAFTAYQTRRKRQETQTK